MKAFNVNSIGRNPKRKQVFNALKKKTCDIFILLDTRICPKIENMVKAEWGGQAFFSSYSSQARGVAILIKKGFPIDILDKKSDHNGNLLSLKTKIYGKIVSITGLYGPNIDSPDFYTQQVFPLIEHWNPDYPIITGDWNLVLDQANDTYNYLHDNNPLARKAVLSAINEHDLIEPWRHFHPNKKRYTWSKKNPKKMARLDFFITSSSLLPYIANTNIEAGIQSDHSLTSLTVYFTKFTKGHGFWKFNNSLLKDQDHNDLVKNTIRRVVKQYAMQPQQYNEEFWSNCDVNYLQYIESTLNPQLYLDIIVMEIRGETIKYGAMLKRDPNEQRTIYDPRN